MKVPSNSFYEPCFHQSPGSFENFKDAAGNDAADGSGSVILQAIIANHSWPETHLWKKLLLHSWEKHANTPERRVLVVNVIGW